jgi:hypothetical protein
MNQPAGILVFHQVLDDGRADNVYEFHKNHIGEYIWPRTIDEFRQLANDGCLYAVYEQSGTQPEKEVGVCYIMDGEDPSGNSRREFGGIYVADECRGAGVASTLGTISISNYYVWDPLRQDQREVEKLVAHVHEFNSDPRGLLTRRLGFKQAGQEIPPVEAPPSMKRNTNGQVVGDLFEFDRTKLLDFADWLESFSGSVSGKKGPQRIARIDVPGVKKYLGETLEALRDLGASTP